MGLNVSTFIAPYGELWRALRKLWHRHLGANVVPLYHSMLRRMNLELISSLHEPGQDIDKALRQCVTLNFFSSLERSLIIVRSVVRIMVMVAYGMDITSKDSQEVS